MKLPIYLDHHSTTPLHAEVLAEMMPWLKEACGNAASKLHLHGQRALEAVERARGQVAQLVEADADWVVFTSGATEAVNLALQGMARARREPFHIVSCTTEHPAVLETLDYLKSTGCAVDLLQPENSGHLKIAHVTAAVRDDTALISLMHANNEIGTINPVATMIKSVARDDIYFHLDAAQTAGKIPVQMKSWGVALCSLSAHKLNGPKGVGALVIRPGVKLKPLQFGGGHERGLRPGTLNVAGIVGFGKACEIAARDMAVNHERVSRMRDMLLEGVLKIPGAEVNGTLEDRLYNNINVSFSGISGEMLAAQLKPRISVSTGSACASAKQSPSHVLQAIGLSAERIHSSIRIGVGPSNTDEEIHFAIQAIGETVNDLLNGY